MSSTDAAYYFTRSGGYLNLYVPREAVRTHARIATVTAVTGDSLSVPIQSLRYGTGSFVRVGVRADWRAKHREASGLVVAELSCAEEMLPILGAVRRPQGEDCGFTVSQADRERFIAKARQAGQSKDYAQKNY